MVVSDDNSVPYLLDPLKAALDAVHAVGWVLHAGIDVELPAVGGDGAHLIEALDGGLASEEFVLTIHLRAPSGGPASDLVGARPVYRGRASESHGGRPRRSRQQTVLLGSPWRRRGQ